jgi:hypothetical protein
MHFGETCTDSVAMAESHSSLFRNIPAYAGR